MGLINLSTLLGSMRPELPDGLPYVVAANGSCTELADIAGRWLSVLGLPVSVSKGWGGGETATPVGVNVGLTGPLPSCGWSATTMLSSASAQPSCSWTAVAKGPRGSGWAFSCAMLGLYVVWTLCSACWPVQCSSSLKRFRKDWIMLKPANSAICSNGRMGTTHSWCQAFSCSSAR